MDYVIDLRTLHDSIGQMNTSLEALRAAQDQLFVISWLLINTGWKGKSADLLGERSVLLDNKLSDYQTRGEQGSTLLRQLNQSAQIANEHASAMASIWDESLFGSIGRLLGDMANSMFYNEDVVSLDRTESERIYSICSDLRDMYIQQEQRIRELHNLYNSCYDDFHAIAFIDAAGNYINHVEDNIVRFNSKLKEYESLIDIMERTAARQASEIIPAEQFSSS